MTRRALWATCLATLLWALPGAPPATGAEDPDPGKIYLRRPSDIAGTIAMVEAEAKRRDIRQVFVVFDVATFAPPPGLTEFTADYAFFEDLESWIEAIGPWANRSGISFRATSSLNPVTVAVGSSDWRSRLEELVTRSWWDGDAVPRIEPAVRWMRRLLQRNEAAIREASGRARQMLVLVSGGLTPERWVTFDQREGYESEWRTKLLPIGQYWDEEGIGSLLASSDCTLFVVAPEARFGDFSPMVELPELPWAARPQFPMLPGHAPWVARAGRRRNAPPAGPSRDALRRQLEESLRDVIPDAKERARRIDEILREREPTTPGNPAAPPAPLERPSANRGLRFRAYTPVWFDRHGSVILQNNHAPSGYGWWPYARAVAKTGGRYLFYPFPESPWLDKCPASEFLLDRLAPEYVPRRRFLGRREGDRALDAVCRAVNIVVDDTPWADTFMAHRAASGWSHFLRANPLRMQPDAFLRRRPFDTPLTDAPEGIERVGATVRKQVLPRYDEALSILNEAIRLVDAGANEGSHARSVANLRLARYWFAMSAFHLNAFSIYATEVDRFIPESMKGKVDYVHVTYVPTIRMSDVLEAYDGRRLSLADETKYQRWAPPDTPGYQGNILNIPETDPNYRAQRWPVTVLRCLDPRLHDRADAMIHAARDVMEHVARTGWGWTTYYSEAFTFIFHPVETATGHRPTPGGVSTPDRPTTPYGPATGPGSGSTPGGPATGR